MHPQGTWYCKVQNLWPTRHYGTLTIPYAFRRKMTCLFPPYRVYEEMNMTFSFSYAIVTF